MNKINEYKKVDKYIKISAIQEGVALLFQISKIFLFIQFINVCIASLWYPTIGEEHIASYGYELKDLIWPSNTNDNVLFPLFFIQALIGSVLSFLSIYFIPEKKDNEQAPFIVFSSFVTFLILSFFNIHIGSLIFLFSLFSIAFLGLYAFNVYSRRKLQKEYKRPEKTLNKLFHEIINCPDTLSELSKDKKNNKILYNRVYSLIIKEHKSEIFDFYCKKNKSESEEIKKYNESYASIENS